MQQGNAHEEARFEEQDMEFIRNSRGVLARCGYSYANLCRSVRYSRRVIGLFRWGEVGGDRNVCMVERAPLVWRLGGTWTIRSIVTMEQSPYKV